jgi:hypothetical protein
MSLFAGMETGMDKGLFLGLFVFAIIIIIMLSTGSIMILSYLWDLVNGLSQTIPLWLGFVLLIVFLVLIRPKN